MTVLLPAPDVVHQKSARGKSEINPKDLRLGLPLSAQAARTCGKTDGVRIAHLRLVATPMSQDKKKEPVRLAEANDARITQVIF